MTSPHMKHWYTTSSAYSLHRFQNTKSKPTYSQGKMFQIILLT